MQNNVVRTPPFTLQYAPVLYGDSYGVQVYAVAKDIFGNTLGTTATISLNFRSIGTDAFFDQSLAGNLSGDLVLKLVTPHTRPANGGPQTLFYFDGRAEDEGWIPQSGVGGYTGSCANGSGGTMHTARFPDGTHELFAMQYQGLPAYQPSSSMTFAPGAVNTGADTITLPCHPLRTTVAGETRGPSFVLSTTGTLPAPLQLATTYYAVGTVYAESASDLIQVAATPGGAPIDITTQGTGTHTITWTLPNPQWCDQTVANCLPIEVNSVVAPYAYRRVIITTLQAPGTAMEMRTKNQDCFLTPGSSTDATGNTCSFAPVTVNTDGTTTADAATDATYTLNIEGGVSGCVTVGATTGIVTAAGSLPASPCYANVTVHCTTGACSGLPDRTGRVMAMTTQAMPHLSKTGAVLTAYDPANSYFPRGMYGFGLPFTGGATPWAAQEAKNAAINTTDDGLPADLGDPNSASCAAAVASFNGSFNSVKTFATAAGTRSWWQNFNWVFAPWNWQIFTSDFGYNRHVCAQAILTSLVADGRAPLMQLQDEPDGLYGGDPTPARTVGGSEFTSLTTSGGAGSTVFAGLLGGALTNWNQSCTVTGAFSTCGSWLQIINATTAGLNGVYPVSSVTLDGSGTRTVAFTIKTSATDGAYNAGNNPGMQVVNWEFAPGFGAYDRCYLPGKETAGTTAQSWDANLTSIVVTGTNLMTIHWTNHGFTTGQIIHIWPAGGTNSFLNFVGKVTRLDANTLTAVPLVTATNGTYNSSDGQDAKLTITFVCPLQNDNLPMSNFMTTMNGVYGHPAYLWPILGGSYSTASAWKVNNWMNNQTMAQAAYIFAPSSANNSQYGNGMSAQQSVSDKIQSLYTQRAYIQEPRLALNPDQVTTYVKESTGFQFNPDQDRPQGTGLSQNPAQILAPIWWYVAGGVTGFKSYTFQNSPSDTYNTVNGNGINVGVRHYINAPEYIATALSFQTIQRFEKYLLQPRINSPDLGPMFYTAARQVAGNQGRILIVGCLNEMPYSQTIDFTPFRYGGGSITRYSLNAMRLLPTTLSSSALDETYSFCSEPGEVVIYKFNPSGTLSDLDTLTVPAPNLPVGASKMALRVGYYPGAVDNVDAMDCTAGCSVLIDTQNSSHVWLRYFYLDSSNVVKYGGEPQRW